MQLIDVVFVAAAAFADYVEPGLSGIEAAFNHEIGRELGFVLRSAAKIDQTLHVIHNTRAQIERQIPASGPNIAHSEAYEGSATFEFPSSDIGSWAAENAYRSWYELGRKVNFRTRPAETDSKHRRPRSDRKKPR